MIVQHVLSRVFLGSAQKKLFGDGVPILAYHSVADPPPGVNNPYLYVSQAEFDSQLAQLRNAGFTSTSLDEFNGFRSNHHQHVVISFDDGIRNVLDNALDILARHQVRAVQFIISDLIGRRNEWMIARGDVPEPLMDQHQIRDWLAAGHQIGAHTATHAHLVRLSPAQAREEIIGSKQRLEDLFGIPVNHFCYPFGEYNHAVRDIVADAGYRTACTSKFGVNNALTQPYELRRVAPLSPSKLLGTIQHRARTQIRSFGRNMLGRKSLLAASALTASLNDLSN